MKLKNKQLYILLGISSLLVIIVIGVGISFLFQSQNEETQNVLPTPTPVPYTRDAEGNFTFTSLQRTTINRTSAEEVEERENIISRSISGSTTIYEVESATLGEVDEIRTQNGLVVFESINIFNKDTGDYPPKATVYEREFGEPEKVLEGVSQLGLHIAAHIYAEDGFTLFVNRATNTVYEVHRYVPMTTEGYEAEYGEYLQPAPDYPQEFHTQ